MRKMVINVVLGQPHKLNKAFQFDKEILLDRFMLENRDEAIKINKQIKDLKDEVRK